MTKLDPTNLTDEQIDEAVAQGIEVRQELDKRMRGMGEPQRTLTESDVRRIVLEMLGVEGNDIAYVYAGGGQSFQALGRLVGDAALRSPFVVLDGRRIRTVAGRKPWWRP